MSEDINVSLEKRKEEKTAEDILQLVSFNLGEEEFGIDILIVKEIIRIIDVTRVPNAPYYVEGVINLRGKVVPIIDLKRRLGLPESKFSKNTRIIVVDLESKVIGFIVDQVNEVLRVNKSITENPPSMASNIDSEFITSIGKLENRLLILLDLEKVVTADVKANLGELGEI
jgi:purine-binding chemotaxis protein CheW